MKRQAMRYREIKRETEREDGKGTPWAERNLTASLASPAETSFWSCAEDEIRERNEKERIQVRKERRRGEEIQAAIKFVFTSTDATCVRSVFVQADGAYSNERSDRGSKSGVGSRQGESRVRSLCLLISSS
jgi:hypothetical protein